MFNRRRSRLFCGVARNILREAGVEASATPVAGPAATFEPLESRWLLSHGSTTRPTPVIRLPQPATAVPPQSRVSNAAVSPATVAATRAAPVYHATVPLSEPRGDITIAGLGDLVFFAGGTIRDKDGLFAIDTVDIYNRTTARVTHASLSEARSGMAVATAGTKLFLAGGHAAFVDPGRFIDSSAVDIYDSATGRWTSHALSAAGLSKAVVAGGKVIILTGSSVDIYDTATDQWSSAPLMTQRHDVSVDVVGSAVLFSGGYLDAGGLSDAVEIYHADTARWSTSTLPVAAVARDSVVVGNEVVIATDQRNLEVYDASTGRWTATPYPDGLIVNTLQLFSVAGRIVLATRDPENAVNSSYTLGVYDLAAHQFTLRLSPRVHSYGIAVVGDKLVFGGGSGEDGGVFESDAVNVYDVATDTWTTGTLSRPVELAASATLGSEALFVDGDTADIYDTATGASAVLPAAESGYTGTEATLGDEAFFAPGFLGQTATADVYRLTPMPSPADLLPADGLHHVALTLSEPRDQVASAAVGTRMLFAGGFDRDSAGDQVASAAVDLCDTATGQWAAARLSQARQTTAVTVGNKVLFAGGNLAPVPLQGGPGPASDVVDIYDDGTQSWSTARLSAAGTPVSTVVGDKAVFIVGDVADVYDSTTGNWSTAPLASQPRTPLTTLAGGRLFIVDGSYDAPQTTAIDVYDAATGDWSTIYLPHLAIVQSAAAVGDTVTFTDGASLHVFHIADATWATFPLAYSFGSTSLYEVGGTIVIKHVNPYLGGTPQVSVFDPASGTLTELDTPGAAGENVAVVGDKIVFAGGGGNDSGPYSADGVAVYDVGTGQWTSGQLAEAISGARTQVAGQTVIFSGGPLLALYDTNTQQASAATLTESDDGQAVVVNGEIASAGGIDYGPYPFTTAAVASAGVDLYTPSDLPAPLDPAPATGAGVADSPADFSWAASPGATSYDVYLDDVKVATVGTNEWTADRTLATGSHAWQVVARTSSELTPGPRWQFTVGPPAAPTNPTPVQGARLGRQPLTLSWDPSLGATSYDVYLDGRLIRNVPTNSVSIDAVMNGGKHTWQVIAKNELTDTPGPMWRFRTNADRLWQEVLSPNTGGGAAVTLGTKVLIVPANDSPRHFHDATLYDARTQTFSTLPAPYVSGPGTAVGNKAIFKGSTYNGDTGMWSPTPVHIPHGAVATTVDGRAIFAGGYESSDGSTAAVEIYDNATGRWSTAQLSQPRSGLAATTVGDLAIFAGGFTAPPDSLAADSDVVDIYNARTGKWSAARLSEARGNLAATAVGDLALFAGGSETNGPHPDPDVVDIYNAKTGAWSVDHLLVGRPFIAAATVGTKAIFAGGGSASGGEGTGVVDVFDAATGQWSNTTLPVDRSGMSAATVGNQALFIGGVSNYGTPLTGVERFVDPSLPISPAFLTARIDRVSLGRTVQAGAAGTISLALFDKNTGGVAGPFTVDVYLSSGSGLDRRSVKVGSAVVKPSLSIAGGVAITTRIALPRGMPAGNYRIVVAVPTGRHSATMLAAGRQQFTVRAAAQSAHFA